MKNDETPSVYKKYIKNGLKTKTASLPCVTPKDVKQSFKAPKSEIIK